MAKVKKGGRLVCIPCGREVVVDSCGMSETSVWCCGQPMAAKTRRAKKKR